MRLSPDEAVRAVVDGCPGPVPHASTVFVIAHPDDEVISAASRLPALAASIRIICVTDGSPITSADAQRHGFAGRDNYASTRRREMEQALDLAGIWPEQVLHLDFPDQGTSSSRLLLTRRIASALRRLRPAVVVTHPYEGGHPDHDSTAFAVHAARHLLEESGADPPPLVEMTSYHLRDGEICPFEFLPDPACPVTTVTLSQPERRLKSRMLQCHATQRETLSYFPVELERFRPAPEYDFTSPPHAGKLFYEHFDWGITGAQWRELVSAALEKLEVSVPQ